MKAVVAKIGLAALLLVFISGCERKSCQDVVCQVGQQCIQGGCYCTDGYEGDGCSTYSYLKFEGSYNVTEACSNASPNFFNYNVTIYHDPLHINQVQITNLFGLGVTAVGYIHTDGTTGKGTYLEIPYQNQGSLTFQGQGNYDVLINRMSVQFNYTFNGGSYACTHTFYKQ